MGSRLSQPFIGLVLQIGSAEKTEYLNSITPQRDMRPRLQSQGRLSSVKSLKPETQ